MKILMYINISHNTTAIRIILKIIKNPVNLIHHSFPVLMFHTQLITICLTDRTIFICPAIPDMAVKIMDVIRFLLPDPQNLIHGAFQCCFTKCQCRKFFPEVITIDHTKFLDGICRSAILPYRADFLAFCTGAVLDHIFTHIYKGNIC